jgi:hypothetical protein
MFELDTGSSGVGGPFLQWSARGTQDGSVAARSFYIRDGARQDALRRQQRAWSWTSAKMKTGWHSVSEGIAGVAPEWKWNPSVSQMMPSPGDDWKKGFSIPVATGGGATATWEQAGTGSLGKPWSIWHRSCSSSPAQISCRWSS